MDGLKGSSYPGQIWKEYMGNIHEGLPQLGFLPYAQLSQEFTDNLNEQQTTNPEEGEPVQDQLQEGDVGQQQDNVEQDMGNGVENGVQGGNNPPADNQQSDANNNVDNDNNLQNTPDENGGGQEETTNQPQPPAQDENTPIENGQ